MNKPAGDSVFQAGKELSSDGDELWIPPGETEYSDYVVTLSQMFPNVTLRDISKTIVEYDGDFDKACDSLLTLSSLDEVKDEGDWYIKDSKPQMTKTDSSKSESTRFPTEYANEGEYLSQIFPQIPTSEILRHLKTEDKDINRVYDILSNYNALRKKNVKVKLDSIEATPVKPLKTWDSLHQETSLVCELTQCKRETAKFYLLKHNSVALAAKLIVENEESPNQSLPLKKVPEGPIKIAASRVQSASTSLRNSPKVSAPDISSLKISEETLAENLTPEKVDKCGESAVEILEKSKLDQPDLFKLPDLFYTKLLVYFNGDVDKIVNVAKFIINHKAFEKSQSKIIPISIKVQDSPKESFKPVAKQHNKPLPARGEADYFSKSNHYLQMAKSSSDKSVKAYYSKLASENKSLAIESFKENNYNLQDPVRNEYLQTGRLDLHGLTVEVAIDLVRRIVQEWWRSELDKREQLGKSTKYGKAIYVEPLHIITGRGIHSSGGVSKLKTAVRHYLNTGKIIFDENSSSFTVQGKR